MSLRFAKYEGLGNDFLVVDGDPADFPPERVARLCDRHFGVGGDGVLVVTRGERPGMVVLNADGGRPEMCGNGLRCVAVHLAAGTGARELVVDTDAGPKRCVVEGDDVTIDMGVAEDLGPIDVEVAGRAFRLHRVSMGNPHAITFEPTSDEDFRRFGLPLATSPVFPEGTNVELVRLDGPRALSVRVWERGVGPTLACGTGACAVAALAAIEGRTPFGEEVTVTLPGGPLVITVARDLRVTMRGPARLVFRGEVPA